VRRVLAAFVLAVTAACGRTELHEVMLRAPAVPPSRPVEIYVVGQDPGRPYDEVALVEAVGFGADADAEHVVRTLGHRAGELGCDAVVRVRVDTGSTMVHGYGVCVRWLVGRVVRPETLPAPAAAPTPAPAASERPL
jgi:hypothetical protein